MSMTLRRVRSLCPYLVLPALLLAAGGCRSAPETAVASDGPVAPPEPWSTKGRSVLPRDPVSPRLNLPAPYEPTARASVQAAATELLRQAADSTEPLLRKHAIEALASAPTELEPVVRLGLGDENRGVRFAATMTVGEQRLRSLAALVEPLTLDPSASVRAAAIYALSRCGRPVDPSPLAAMLASDDAEVRGNAVWIIGKLGEPSALPMLRELALRAPVAATDMRQRIVDLQVAEAMVRLGDESAREILHAALFAPGEQAEVTALATQIVADLGDRSAVAVLKQLANPGGTRVPIEVQLAAARALAELAPASELSVVPLQHADSPRPELRELAASVLGCLGDPAQLPRVTAMMDDPSARVQIAAAGAVLELLATR